MFSCCFQASVDQRHHRLVVLDHITALLHQNQLCSSSCRLQSSIFLGWTLNLQGCTLKRDPIVVFSTTECLPIVICVSLNSWTCKNVGCSERNCDSVVRNYSELKQHPVFMNGQWALRRCNTYFNVLVLFLFLYCAIPWVQISLMYQLWLKKASFFTDLVANLFI